MVAVTEAPPMVSTPEVLTDEEGDDRLDNDAEYFEALINGDETIAPDDPIHVELASGLSSEEAKGPLMSVDEAMACLSPELREVLDDRLRADFREVRPYRSQKKDF